MSAAQSIDDGLGEHVLVYGSLPPEGSDLDLLVRPEQQQAVEAALRAAGFERRDDEWARFSGTTADLVEWTSAASWDLPAEQLRALFDEARAIEGFTMLVRPAPHHDLLILARRIACGEGVLDAKRRARLELALAEDPEAWGRAQELAQAWQARTALEALQVAWRTDKPIPEDRRAAARLERGGPPSWSPGVAASRLKAGARRIPRPGRGAVVAFSGLDGAGKSSQAAGLRDTLERLGYDAVVVRTRITWDDPLWRISEPIKRLLTPPMRMLTRLRSTRGTGQPETQAHAARHNHSDPPQTAPDGTRPEPLHPVTRVREESAILTDLWTLMITFANAYVQWKLMRRALVRGAIVLCDRYTLDSIVELRYSYGRERPFRLARLALVMLYPKPVRAYFLDLPPQTAFERKGEWGIPWLTEHRDLYLEECERLGVRLLDGERPVEDLCAEVAREVWLSGI